MQTVETVFRGTKAEQQLARDVWLAMRMFGANFAVDAPIRQPLEALTRFFERQPGLAGAADATATLDKALRANDHVFAREKTADGAIVYVTTRAGHTPVAVEADTSFDFKTRLTVPEPAEVLPPRPQVVPVPEPQARVSPMWLRGAAAAPPADEEVGEALAPELVTAEPAPPVVGALAAATAEPVAEAVATPAVSTPTPVVEAPPPVPVDVEPAAVEAALRERLGSDLRLITFGDEWYLDDQVMRLSRGDTKRLRDYLVERGEPLSDEDLLGDVFGRRINDRDYALIRFGLNARMGREKRDFEFVGTVQSRRWSTGGLPTIGTAKRKVAELGQDFRFLLDLPAVERPAEAAPSWSHALTFFEYEYGLLTLDANLAGFLPAPYLDEQRAAVVRFDVPQLYLSYLVEIRYPTANRGGFVAGLDQFFAENLVPGARFTLERTDNDGQYTLKFGQGAAEERRLLHLDERRGRFVFRPVTYYCEVDEDLLLSDQKFAGLNNAKPLDDRDRRRPEFVLRASFERIGEQVGDKSAPRYYALLDDLYAAANIERPLTRDYLVQILQSDAHPEFQRDPDGSAYFYTPSLAQ